MVLQFLEFCHNLQCKYKTAFGEHFSCIGSFPWGEKKKKNKKVGEKEAVFAKQKVLKEIWHQLRQDP